VAVADIEFSKNDDIRQPVQLTIKGVIPSLSGCTVTGIVVWRGNDRIILTEGDGITILNASPQDAFTPHFEFLIPRAQANTFPLGRVAYIEFDVETATDINTSFGPQYFDRKR
jgi:hypothetical protein